MATKIPTPYEFVEYTASIHGWKNLQEKLGISRQSISNWKLGKRSPSAEVILQCASLLFNHPIFTNSIEVVVNEGNAGIQAISLEEFSDEFV